jgi:hypothetical protein
MKTGSSFWRDALISLAWISASLIIGATALLAVDGPKNAGLARAGERSLTRNKRPLDLAPVKAVWGAAGAAELRAKRFTAGKGQLALYVAAGGGVSAWRYVLYDAKGASVADWPLDPVAAASSARIAPGLRRSFAAGAAYRKEQP